MKKVLSLIVIVAAAAMVSCAGNTNKKATEAAEATEQVATECCGECTQAEGECCKGEGECCKGDSTECCEAAACPEAAEGECCNK